MSEMNYTKPLWMKNIDKSVPLSEIRIPGTHNSCTRFVFFSFITRCQRLSVQRQLQMGIRLFDIRLEKTADGFKLVHSIADCRNKASLFSGSLSFDSVFNTFKTFLSDNPSETLIISIKEDDGNAGEAFFDCFYNVYIEPYAEMWFTENRLPTLGECRGKAVLLRRCCAGGRFSDILNTGCGVDLSGWRDQGNRKSSLPEACVINKQGDAPLQQLVIQDRYKHRTKGKWRDAAVPSLKSAVPDKNKAFLHCLNTAGGLSPLTSSNYINKQFCDFAKHSDVTGWFLIDFVDEKIVKAIINKN